jgi:PX domain-containing protein kinase-like protein
MAKGSLRDVIFKANPFKKPYAVRYEVADKNGTKKVGQPIPLAQLQKYGNQILQALVFLKSLKIPYPHLHTENVIINKDGHCWYTLYYVVSNYILVYQKLKTLY